MLDGKTSEFETIPIVIEGVKVDENGNAVPGILRLQPESEDAGTNSGSGGSSCSRNNNDTTTTTQQTKKSPIVEEPITIIGRSNKGLIGAIVNYLKTTTQENLQKKKVGVVGKHTVGRLKRWARRIIELHKMSQNMSFNDRLLNRYVSFKALEKHAKDVDDTTLNMLIGLVKEWGNGMYNKNIHCQVLIKQQLTDIRMFFRTDTPHFANRIHTLLDNTVACENADIRLSTVHQSKGLEFSKVRLANDFAGLIDISKFNVALNLLQEYQPIYIRDEDFNLWYVAITRAQNILEYNLSFQEFLKKLSILYEAGLLNRGILEDHPCPLTLDEIKQMAGLD